MTENDRMQCKLLASLLAYPDAAWKNALPELAEVVAALEEDRGRQTLGRFLEYAGATPEIRLQETYTGTFDLNPAASLNLTHHLLGESEDRGKALASLLAAYAQEGYEALPGELPDYLPMMLEFLAVCPASADAGPVRACLSTVPDLAARLEREKHPYAGLLGLAADILRERGYLVISPTRKEA